MKSAARHEIEFEELPPFGKYALEYCVRLAVSNVLFWPFHRNSICSIVPDLAISASAHVSSCSRLRDTSAIEASAVALSRLQ
jgi:hypothetical protein